MKVFWAMLDLTLLRKLAILPTFSERVVKSYFASPRIE